MRVIFTIITFIAITVTARSSCIGGLVDVFPRNKELVINPVIFIEFSEQDYQLYNQLSNQSFTLMTQEGKSIPLKIWKKNKSHKDLAQIVLKPSKSLPENTAVSFQVTGLDHGSEMTQKFIDAISSWNWQTSDVNDSQRPILQQTVRATYIDRLNWSSSYHGFECEINVADGNVDNYERSGMEFNTLLAEVKDRKGNCYILPVTNNLLLIYDGTCGSSFDLHKDTSFEFTIRLLDFSGNWSKNIVVLKLEKPN